MKQYWEGVTLERMEKALSDRYLSQVGWRESVQNKMPTCNGEPIPWYTYSSIEFLKTIVCKDHKLFEFGAGCSTLFWEPLVKELVTVEHDPDYVEYVESRLSGDGVVLFSDSDEHDKPSERFLSDHLADITIDAPVIAQIADEGFVSYAMKLLDYEKDYFDVIVVDGVARTLCILLAINHFSDAGIIVLDNSERDDSRGAISVLKSSGFRRIDFWGLGPVNPYGWCTSVFFRDKQTGEPVF